MLPNIDNPVSILLKAEEIANRFLKDYEEIQAKENTSNKNTDGKDSNNESKSNGKIS